jgi:hypothetical protein
MLVGGGCDKFCVHTELPIMPPAWATYFATMGIDQYDNFYNGMGWCGPLVVGRRGLGWVDCGEGVGFEWTIGCVGRRYRFGVCLVLLAFLGLGFDWFALFSGSLRL